MKDSNESIISQHSRLIIGSTKHLIEPNDEFAELFLETLKLEYKFPRKSKKNPKMCLEPSRNVSPILMLQLLTLEGGEGSQVGCIFEARGTARQSTRTLLAMRSLKKH